MTGQEINTILDLFRPVSLEEMDSFRLMNRIDIKFVFAVNRAPELLSLLPDHYRILEIRNKRSFRYNTRYLDTEDMLFYTQHVTGRLARYKVRYRKYEATGETFLEIKKKTNKNRTLKWRKKNNTEQIVPDDDGWLFIRKHIPFNSFVLQPNIENNFTRITLTGINSHERITLDSGMRYETVTGESRDLPYLAIAELKSERHPGFSPFVSAVRTMGLQPVGFSKYCIGNALLRDIPKKNILKENILLINKIENEYSKSDGS